MECGDYVKACPKTYVNHSRGKMFCRCVKSVPAKLKTESMKCKKNIHLLKKKYFMASNWQPLSSPVGVVVVSFQEPMFNVQCQCSQRFFQLAFRGVFLTVFFHKHRHFVCLKKRCCQVNLRRCNMTPLYFTGRTRKWASVKQYNRVYNEV